MLTVHKQGMELSTLMIFVAYATCHKRLNDDCILCMAFCNNIMPLLKVEWVRVMVFNATFNNISVILWWSVSLVEETGVSRENHRPAYGHWQTLSHNVVSRTPRHERDLRIDIASLVKQLLNLYIQNICSIIKVVNMARFPTNFHLIFTWDITFNKGCALKTEKSDVVCCVKNSFQNCFVPYFHQTKWQMLCMLRAIGLTEKGYNHIYHIIIYYILS